MVISKMIAAVAATAVVFGLGAVNVAPASATDNIRTFGEQARLNGPNSLPYIGYTVSDFGRSNDPVPHNGDLYSAKLVVDGFGGNTNPMIERFGARAQSGEFYPAIMGASNLGKLYFDVVGPVPNSVVWNDGIRDILAWVPGETPLEPASVMGAPSAPGAMSAESFVAPGAMPAQTDPAIVASPNPIPNTSDPLTEAIVSEPGFNAVPGGRR